MGNDRLRTYRRLRGWSQEDVAQGLVDIGIELGERQVGVTRGLVSRWERGASRPRSPYPKLLCKLFDATAEDLGLVAPSNRPSGSGKMDSPSLEDDVERRAFLRLAIAAPVGMALPSVARSSATKPPLPGETLDAIASVVREYHRMSDRTPGDLLLGPTLAHIAEIHRLADEFGWSKELAATASDASLLAAWLGTDLGDEHLTEQQHRAAIAFAQRAGNPVLEAYMAGWLSFWLAETGRHDEATRYLSQALTLAPASARPRLALIEASVHSQAGEKQQCLRALGRAEEAIGTDHDPLWSEAFSLDEARLARYRGGCTTDLGIPDVAGPMLDQVLAEGPEGLSQVRGRTLADRAMTHVHSGEIEQACATAGEAFEVARGTRCARVFRLAQKARRAFPASWNSTPDVKALDDRIVLRLPGHV